MSSIEPNPADPDRAATPAADQTSAARPDSIPPPTRPPAAAHWPLLAAGAFMLIGLLLLLYLGRTPPPILDSPMPDPELIGLLNSDAYLDRSEVAGRVVVYHFWGTWCPPCRVEYPEFAAMAADYTGADDVRIVSVSCSPGAEENIEKLREETQAYLQELGVGNMPIYCDPKATTRIQVLNLLGTGSFGYPTTILVDKRGIVRDFTTGYHPSGIEHLRDQIETLRAAP